jgi:phosphohistidine phosphatase
MTLYLVRHGEAVDESEDPARPLNQHGQEEVAAAARLAGALGLDVARIVHSGKLRARQTAEIWAAALQPRPPIEEYADLQPLAEPRHAAIYVHAARESLMLVGHLPHLGRLLSSLVIGNPGRELIRYPTGAVVALDQADAGGWRIKWLLTPELARAVASAT